MRVSASEGGDLGRTKSAALQRHSGQLGFRSNHGLMQKLWKMDWQPCCAQGSVIESGRLCSTVWQQMAQSAPSKRRTAGSVLAPVRPAILQ